MFEILGLIINTVTGLLATVLLLRFWMQAIRIRPPGSVAQFTFQLTDWLVLRLRRVVPGIGGYDWASMLATVMLAVIGAALDSFGMLGQVALPWLLLKTLHILVQWICYIFFGLVFLTVVFSWVNPYAPLAPFVNALLQPLLRPIRRIVPLFGNIDLSPMVLSILLIVVMRVNDKLFQIGVSIPVFQ
jgi:YggT family protein